MTNEEIVSELAESVRDVIDNTDESYLREDPERAFVDLASRLVLRMVQGGMTIVPATDVEIQQCVSARRILDLFTRYLREHPECFYTTRLDPTAGKFQIEVRDSDRTRAFLQGGSVQDAYGQAATVLAFNGGTFDEAAD